MIADFWEEPVGVELPVGVAAGFRTEHVGQRETGAERADFQEGSPVDAVAKAVGSALEGQHDAPKETGRVRRRRDATSQSLFWHPSSRKINSVDL